MAQKKRKQKRAPRRPRRTRRASSSRPRAHKRSLAAARRARKVKAIAKKAEKVIDPRITQLMGVYGEAMRQFNQQNYRRAREGFEKVVGGISRELAERARVHVAICDQRLQRTAPVHLRSADDHYYFAVSQINVHNYDAARTHLEKARKLAPKADYIYYALASVASLSGEADDALGFLAQAIKLRPENRYHARNDSDFKLLEDDARFQELVNSVRPVSSGLNAVHA